MSEIEELRAEVAGLREQVQYLNRFILNDNPDGGNLDDVIQAEIKKAEDKRHAIMMERLRTMTGAKA